MWPATPDAKLLIDLSAKHTPTANYYETPYFSIHTFKFVDAKGVEHPVKWRFIPRDGVKELSAAEMKAAPHDFLEKNLIERTQKGPAVWDMIVYVGEPGDLLDNPTIAWPETRKHFTAGTLTISQATPQKGAACEENQLRSLDHGRRHRSHERPHPAVPLTGLRGVVRETAGLGNRDVTTNRRIRICPTPAGPSPPMRGDGLFRQRLTRANG